LDDAGGRVRRVAGISGERALPSHRLVEHPVRVAIVGLGAFGVHHARHFAAHPSARLVAVADVDARRAQAAAARFGAAAFADWRDMIGAVDAVSITVPASIHAGVAGAFVEAGNHVLVEKPLAATAGEARELVARARRKGVVLQAGHVERFSPAIAMLSERVKAPRRISCVRRATWSGRSTDVDVVLDLMVHDIGHVLMLAGAHPLSVSAEGRVGRSGLVDEAEAWLTFSGGLVATLSASRIANTSERAIVVTEPDRVYRADLAAPTLTVSERSQWRSPEESIPLQARDSLAAEIDSFIRCVTTGVPPLVGGAEGLAAVEVAERVRRAIADADTPPARSAAQ
jgi:predicted dehydrogenase